MRLLRDRRRGHVFDRPVALLNVGGRSRRPIYDIHPAVTPWTLYGYVRARERAGATWVQETPSWAWDRRAVNAQALTRALG